MDKWNLDGRHSIGKGKIKFYYPLGLDWKWFERKGFARVGKRNDRLTTRDIRRLPFHVISYGNYREGFFLRRSAPVSSCFFFFSHFLREI